MSGDGGENTWHKSSKSNAGECVEVNLGGDQVKVRDSKDPNGPILIFAHPEWRAFIAGVHAGEFDLPQGANG